MSGEAEIDEICTLAYELPGIVAYNTMDTGSEYLGMVMGMGTSQFWFGLTEDGFTTCIIPDEDYPLELTQHTGTKNDLVKMIRQYAEES